MDRCSEDNHTHGTIENQYKTNGSLRLASSLENKKENSLFPLYHYFYFQQ